MKTRETLYNTLVRLHLEYAALVWDPRVTKQKQALDKVQQRTACWVTNQHDSIHVKCHSYVDRTGLATTGTNNPGWNWDVSTPAFAYCTKLQMVLWLRHTFLISFPTVMLHVRSSRHAHTLLQHATYQCRTNYFKYSYFRHTIVLWNALPQAVVSSPTLVAFKTSLRRGRMPQNCNLSCVHINLCRITMSGKVSDLPIRFKRAVFT